MKNARFELVNRKEGSGVEDCLYKPDDEICNFISACSIALQINFIPGT